MKKFFLTLSSLFVAIIPVVSQTYVMSREQLRDVIDPLNLRSSQLMVLATNGVVLSFRAEAGSVASDSAVSFNSTRRAGYKWVTDWNGDVRAFGVKADGVTDDTAATQAALDYAVANGLTLWLPYGYRTSIVAGLTVTNNSNIKGPDDMFTMSSSLVAGEQNRWIWKLKDNANTWVIKYTAGQHSLSGVTIDGNKASNTNDVPALWIDVGFTSYKESHWENIGVFNSAGDGIYNRAHSPVFDRIMSQNNVGNGIVIYNGYDAAITHSYFGGNGKHGILALDHGSFRFVQVDSFQNEMSGIKALNPYLGYFDKIVCNNNLQNGMLIVTAPSTNYTTGSAVTNTGLLGQFSVMNSQLINNNYPLKKDGTTSSVPSGTYSNLKMEGSGSVHPFNFINTQFYLTESSLTNKPKYLVESTASGFPNFYGGNFINCRYTTNASFFSTGAFSGATLTTAGFTQLREATSSADYSYWPLGNLWLGGSGYTGLPLSIAQTGANMIDLERTGLPQKFRISLGFRSIVFTENSSSLLPALTTVRNTTPQLTIGTVSGGSTPKTSFLYAEQASSGKDSPGADLSINSGFGTGASTSGGDINFATPDVQVSGTSIQTNSTKFSILRGGALFAQPITQPSFSVEGMFYWGFNSLAPGTTNWWFAKTNGWVPLPLTNSVSGGSGDVTAAGNNTLTGTNTFSGPTWIKPNRKRVVLFEKDWNAFTIGNAGYPEFNGTSLGAGTASIIAGETNHQGMIRLTASSSANTGYYYLSSLSGLFAEPLLTWESITRVRGTNAGVSKSYGFTDSANTANPTDAIRMWRSNNFLIPQIWNNGSLVQGYEYPVSSNQFLYIKVQVQTNMTDVSFYAEDSDTKTLIASTNLTGTLPASSVRAFGMGHFGFFTNSVAIAVEDLDWSTAYIDTPENR